MSEAKMVGWHHQLDRCEFEQAPGDGEWQGSLACCGPWGCKESDMSWMTEQLQQQQQEIVSLVDFAMYVTKLMFNDASILF